MLTDPIADLFNRIKNAYASGHAEVRLPASRLKREIAQVLAERGFVDSVAQEDEPRPTLVITLRYESGEPAVHEIRRLSRPGQRRYVKRAEIPRVRGGLGTVIVSTPRGIRTGEAARKEGVGGELLCEVF